MTAEDKTLIQGATTRVVTAILTAAAIIGKQEDSEVFKRYRSLTTEWVKFMQAEAKPRPKK
ncbi:MAG TPA: hypothetical protein VGS12_08135 [Caulobacteraceae bacterium]|nr:hypothetical protein [Caulobacteraceae bacterium]